MSHLPYDDRLAKTTAELCLTIDKALYTLYLQHKRTGNVPTGIDLEELAEKIALQEAAFRKVPVSTRTSSILLATAWNAWRDKHTECLRRWQYWKACKVAWRYGRDAIAAVKLVREAPLDNLDRAFRLVE